MEYALLGGIVLIVGAFVAVLWLGKRAGRDAERADQAEAGAEVAARMAEARSDAPSTKQDVLKRLREGGKL